MADPLWNGETPRFTAALPIDPVPRKNLFAVLIFVLTLSFYLYTLLPSLAWGDGTKLQSEAISGQSFVLAEMTPAEFSPDPYLFSKVGVAAWDHPLYIVLGYLLVRAFPFVDPLWMVNFISALFGAGTALLVFLLSCRFTKSIWFAAYASLALAVSHTFWWHSSTPEVYTLFSFLLLVSFYFFDRFEQTGGNTSLMLSAFFLGLAADTHILAALTVPALFLYFLSGKYRSLRLPGWRLLLLPALGFLAGFSLYLIQFIRMSANFPLGEIMGPVFGSTFVSRLGTFSPVLLGQSLLTYLFFLTVQFGPLGLLFGFLGARSAFQDGDPSLRKIVSFFIVFALFGIFYRVTDQFTFFIPSYLFWAMLMGMGAASAFQALPAARRWLLPAALSLLLAASPFLYTSLPRLAEAFQLNDASIGIPRIGVGVRNGLAYYMNPDQRGDFDAYQFGYETISSLPPGSIVIAEWYTDTDEYFILRYFAKIRKVRPDVAVLGWPTQDPFSFQPQSVLDVIDGSFASHPIYLASLSDRFYQASKLVEDYCIVPENNLYRLYARESRDLQCLPEDSVTE